MDGFSIVLAALSYIASIVALVFIIIGIVKMFKNIQTKIQKEALEETFSTLPFVALIIIYATSIVSSLITILLSVKSGGLTIFSIIYDINSLVSSILFLIFFILFSPVSNRNRRILLFHNPEWIWYLHIQRRSDIQLHLHRIRYSGLSLRTSLCS